MGGHLAIVRQGTDPVLGNMSLHGKQGASLFHYISLQASAFKLNEEMKMCDENKRKWIIEQFKCLEEERNAFDRYLWQVPVAALGVTALLLKAIFTISTNDNLICLAMLLSVTICIYAALLVARLHERKSKRCARMLILEDIMGETSIIKGGDPNQYPEDKWERFVNNYIGIVSTAVLGVCILILVAAISLMYCLIAFVRMCIN